MTGGSATSVTAVTQQPGGRHAAPPLVIAHRGNSSVAPENTLLAFEAAVLGGTDLIEIDLQLARDGSAVVLHNDSVDATTDGNGRVDELDREELAALDAGSWFGEVFRGQRLPTSTDVLDFLTVRPGVGLLAELKGVWQTTDVRRFADAVGARNLADRVVVQSFWTETVAALRDAAPELPRGLLISSEPEGLLQLCGELEVMSCNPRSELVAERPGLVDELHGAGIRVMAWTLNEPPHWDMAVRAGVDGIITDRPDRLRGWLAAR